MITITCKCTRIHRKFLISSQKEQFWLLHEFLRYTAQSVSEWVCFPLTEWAACHHQHQGHRHGKGAGHPLHKQTDCYEVKVKDDMELHWVYAPRNIQTTVFTERLNNKVCSEVVNFIVMLTQHCMRTSHTQQRIAFSKWRRLTFFSGVKVYPFIIHVDGHWVVATAPSVAVVPAREIKKKLEREYMR